MGREVGSNKRFQKYSATIFQVHQTILTVSENASLPTGPARTERNVKEIERLLQRVSRKHGRWNEHHPRHRLLEALRGFSSYAQLQQAELDRLQNLYGHASKQQRALLEREIGYGKRFTRVSELIARNQELCDAAVRNALEFYQVDRGELNSHIEQMKTAGRPADRVSVSQALKHLVRDWSAEGVNERDAAIPCILRALSEISAGRPGNDEPLRVALPGAGLGRLGHEVSQLPGKKNGNPGQRSGKVPIKSCMLLIHKIHAAGFEVTNNEWSMYQNVVYRFLENTTSSNSPGGAGGVHYPFIDSWSHHKTALDMLRPVPFPDIPLNSGAVVLVEGDFTTVFADSTASFDVVVTHFFIDTARNIMTYLDTIFRILKPGGYWVNFGPLLYGSAPFVQLSLEDIVTVAKAMGFEFQEAPETCGAASLPGKKVRGVEAVYGFDSRALTKNAYDAQFWVARRL